MAQGFIGAEKPLPYEAVYSHGVAQAPFKRPGDRPEPISIHTRG